MLLDFKARPCPKPAGFSGKLIVKVKPAAAKQPDKKDNQDHETDNADTASGSVPVIAVIAAEAATENEQKNEDNDKHILSRFFRCWEMSRKLAEISDEERVASPLEDSLGFGRPECRVPVQNYGQKSDICV